MVKPNEKAVVPVLDDAARERLGRAFDPADAEVDLMPLTRAILDYLDTQPLRDGV